MAGNFEPSLRRSVSSIVALLLLSRWFKASSIRGSAGSIRPRRPALIISCLVRPNIAQAAGFAVRIVPCLRTLRALQAGVEKVHSLEARLIKFPWLVSRLLVAEGAEKRQYVEKQVIVQINDIELKYMNDCSDRDDEQALHTYVEKNWQGYKTLVLQVMHAFENDNIAEARDRMEDSLLHLERVNDGLKMIVVLHERDVADKTGGIVRTIVLAQQNMLMLVIVALLTFIFISVIAFRKITSTERQLRKQAYHDDLTGLPNRFSFQQTMREELRRADRTDGGAVLFLDMDNFKIINDHYGHDAGDQFLVMIANKISSLCNANVFGARFGGDEFALCMRKADVAQVKELLKKLQLIITEPVQAKSKKIPMLYTNLSCWSDITARQIMEQNLKQAVDRNEFSLVYQPLICVTSHQLIGLEALLRWNQSSLATSRQQSLSLWQRQQLMQENFIEIVEEVVQTQEISLDSLKIEITETVLVESFPQIKTKIKLMREMGIKICLDDFGTGYSSINYLTRLPLDILKLDKSLIRDLNRNERSQVLFKNLIHMAHDIGIQVVAEGVESQQQMELIRELGCDYAQGYYIGRPDSAAAIIQHYITRP
ncbi:hypothetical protein Lal_00006923 [Lupinus albus]|nr:hypothetical protein Lal_00006923 [Lupinus albus]